jgi:acetyltransferase-like isoleucine patch superfamily enzyme
VRHPEKIKIGKNVCIGARSRIYANGGLEIGDNTRISANVVVLTENHRYEADRLPYGYQNDERPIKIGRNVWIGLNVCITPGTIIGDGAIIGMGSVVSGRVPPLAIVGPAKWRVLLYRDKEKYRRLDTAGQYFSESSVMRSYICAHKFFDMKG